MSGLITVVIPARNEEDAIADAIDSIGRQDFDLSRVEVVVVDGASDDDTAEMAKRALDQYPFRRSDVVANLERRTPANLNRGLLWAEGDLLVRVDARSRVSSNYLRCIEEVFARPEVAVVGGRQVAIARDGSMLARGIARALNNSLAMGLARYRRNGASSGAVDTVYLGSFRTEVLRSLGGWNERFATNQDFELNRRMSTTGLVWFDDRLAVDYIPRASVGELFHQYHRFGRWKVAYWSVTQDRPQPRQLALIGAPIVAGVGAGTAITVLGAKALGTVGLVGAAAGFAVDHVGSKGTPASVSERAVAISANAAVAAGWFSGVLRGVIRNDAMLSQDRRSAPRR